MPGITEPGLTLEQLMREMNRIQFDLLQTKRNFLFMAELVKKQNEMLDVAIRAFNLIAEEKTGCDWTARQTALAAMKRMSLIKLPDEKTFAVVLPAS